MSGSGLTGYEGPGACLSAPTPPYRTREVAGSSPASSARRLAPLSRFGVALRPLPRTARGICLCSATHPARRLSGLRRASRTRRPSRSNPPWAASTVSTFSCEIAYSVSPAASRASAMLRNPCALAIFPSRMCTTVNVVH